MLSEIFAIEEDTGVLSKLVALDFETTATYTFTVSAHDTNNISGAAQWDTHVSDVTVTVSVIDVNDNAPLFTQDVYEVKMDEDASGQNLIQVRSLFCSVTSHEFAFPCNFFSQNNQEIETEGMGKLCMFVKN